MINIGDIKDIEDFFSIVDSTSVPIIDEKTNFWLIRAESGIFYDEFITGNFVALGWNSIKKEEVTQAYLSEGYKKELYNDIESTYDTKQPGGVFNKCDRFINEIKEGDIFMIPDKNSKEITFAFAGDYFEDTHLEDKEVEFLAQKKAGWSDIFENIKCPYSKRRKIHILKRIKGDRLNPNLYRALISYHGVSDINDYSDEVLSSIYPMYCHQNNLSLVFRVETQENVQALPYSSLTYNLAKYISDLDDCINLSIKTNVSSPGDIIIKLSDLAAGFMESKLPYFILIWITLWGGKFFGVFEVNSFISILSAALNDKQDRKLKELEIKSSTIDLRTKEIEHSFFIKSLQDPVRQSQLTELSKTVHPLELDVNDFNNIIDIGKYKKYRDK